MFTAEQIRLCKIFHPFAFEKHLVTVAEGGRFVHYTSADAAMSILRSKEVWMRNASCMNDYREIDYGMECLQLAFKSGVGQKCQRALDRMFKDLSSEITKLFDSWVPHFRSNTYLFCVSDHLESEDNHGRLSMWRAYGNGTRLALVLKHAPFLSPSDALKAYTRPI